MESKGSNSSEASSNTPVFVKLNIISELTAAPVERPFPVTMKIAEFKNRLELVSGVSNTGMQLAFEDEQGKVLRTIVDKSHDAQTLADFNLRNGIVVRVRENAASEHKRTEGEFDNTDNVEKYEISEAAYAQRDNSMLAFKKQHGFGRFDGDRQKTLQEDTNQREQEEREHVANMHVGDRCQVRVAGQATKRGKVSFIGSTKFKPGTWVGIQYDEPVGKNDGSVDGVQYFQCTPNYGAFVRPLTVEVGDFPEADLDAEMGEL